MTDCIYYRCIDGQFFCSCGHNVSFTGGCCAQCKAQCPDYKSGSFFWTEEV